jgi:CheY-like chemotaxis protein
MKHILLCDDDQAITEVTSEILRHYGYKVTTLSDCTDICAQVERIRPDLILMDLWIPENGGESAVCELKSYPPTSHIPVLIFSAVNDAEKIAKRCRAEGVINKPFDMTDFETLLQKYLTQAAS